MHSIEKQIQPLNPQMELNVNSNQTDSTIKPSNRIECKFLSKTDSTIKTTNEIKRQF